MTQANNVLYKASRHLTSAIDLLLCSPNWKEYLQDVETLRDLKERISIRIEESMDIDNPLAPR